MPLLGTTEIILIVVVLILIFGATRLPKLAKALGQSRQAFRAGLKEADEEIPQKRKKGLKTRQPTQSER